MIAVGIRAALSWLSPAGPGGRLSILIFHRVHERPDELFPDEPDAVRFEQRMRWVRDWFNVVPLTEGIERLFAGTIASRAMAITFDDGYADNERVAAPILNRLGLPATFFVATQFLDGGCMWNDRIIEAVRRCSCPRLDAGAVGLGELVLASAADRRAAVDAILVRTKHLEGTDRARATRAIVAAAGVGETPGPMMRPDQLRNLRRMGMDIGAHTVSHPILTRLPPPQAHAEIAQGKQHLEGILGEPVRLFAYPNGVPNQDYASEHVQMVRECGFSAAVSTAWGAARATSPRFQLPRFTPWDRSRLRWGVRLAVNLRRPEPAGA